MKDRQALLSPHGLNGQIQAKSRLIRRVFGQPIRRTWLCGGRPNNTRAIPIMVTMVAVLALLGPASDALGDLSPARSAAPRLATANTRWNSGWVAIAPGQTLAFTHGLGGDPALYAVDLWFRDTRSPGLGLHQRAYGGMDVAGARYGAYWHNLTADSVSVTRLPDDVAVAQVLLRVWIPDPLDYDSGWVAIAPGQTLAFTHNLGGNADDYTVGLKFQDTTSGGLGIHHYAFGGLEAAGVFYGAAWQNLTDTSLEVQRFGGDASVHQVRVLITRPDPPDYDSGWVDVAQGATHTLAHNLGGEPYSYVVRPSTRSAASGIHAWGYGGLEVNNHFFGGNWQNLNASAITLFRRPHDTFAEQVRVRIWLAEAAEAGPWQNWTNANFVRSLALQNGALWAGTEGGAVRWNPATGQYTKYLAPDGLEDGDVVGVLAEASGTTWFGTAGGGLVAYDVGTWTPFSYSDGLAHSYVYAVTPEDGLLWVATDGGLNAFDDGGTVADKTDDTWTTFRTEDGLSYNGLRAVALDSSGRKWIGTYSGGLNVLDDGGTPHDKADDTWMSFTTSDGLVYFYVYAIVVDGQERVWSATTAGLSVLDFAGTPFDKADDIWMSFTPADGLTDDDVYDLALDNQNRLWVPTYGGGIFVLDHGDTPFDKSDDTWTQFTTSDGLVSNWLYALALDEPAGQVWAGSWGYGISRLDYSGTVEDKSDDTWTTFATDDSLPDNTVRALLTERDRAWVGTSGGGLTVTDGETWSTFTTADGLASTYVYDIARHGSLKAMGTSYGLNLFDNGGTPFDKADDTWATFRTSDGLNTDIIYGLDSDAAGRLWIGSQPVSPGGEYVGGGLSVLDDGTTPFDKADDTWMTYLPEDSGGACNGWVYGLATDGPRWVWAATYHWWDGSQYVGGGLAFLDHASTPFDKSDDAWTVFTTADGLSYNGVYAVALDDAGQVWVGTASGLSVLDHAGTPLDTSDDTWTRFSTSDGMTGSVVRTIAFDPTGRLWLATSGGLSILDTAGTPHEKADDTWLSWCVADGLVDSYLYSVAFDDSGAAWVGAATGLGRMRGAVQIPLYLPLVMKG